MYTKEFVTGDALAFRHKFKRYARVEFLIEIVILELSGYIVFVSYQIQSLFLGCYFIICDLCTLNIVSSLAYILLLEKLLFEHGLN